MLGLFYLIFFGLYGWLSIWLIKRAIKAAKVRGISGWMLGLPVALVMYHLVFWDWLPTVVMHQRACSAEAGFWEYKTVEQWKAEHPGVLEKLIANKGAPSSRKGDDQNSIDTYFLNQRFNWVVKRSNDNSLNRWRREEEVVDIVSGEVIARYVDFSTSQVRQQPGWSGWKFWLAKKHCRDGDYSRDKLRELMNIYNGVRK